MPLNNLQTRLKKVMPPGYSMVLDADGYYKVYKEASNTPIFTRPTALVSQYRRPENVFLFLIRRHSRGLDV